MEAGERVGSTVEQASTPLSPRDTHSYVPYGRTRVTQVRAQSFLMVTAIRHPQPARWQAFREVCIEAAVSQRNGLELWSWAGRS